MYSPLRHLPALFYKHRPIQLTYFVTRQCNARCPYCFYLASKNDTQQNEAELNLDEIQQVSNSLGSLLWLAFSGGEIFLRKDLAAISQIFYRQNKPCIMLYPTNGMQPQHIKNTMQQILETCPKSVIAVKLSIDGIGEQHDGLRNTPGSFNKTLQTYHDLLPFLERYKNFELGFNTVFCSENQHDMNSIIDYVASLEHAPLHTISMVRGNLNEPHYKNIDLEKYRQASERLASNMKKRISSLFRFNGARLKAAQDILQRRLIYATLQQKQSQLPCYAGLVNLVLNEIGDVYPCEMLHNSFGNVCDYQYNIQKVLKTEQAKIIQARIKNRQCYCTHECYMMTNTLLNTRQYPVLVKEYLGMLNGKIS
ncbi:MAG: radical SAM protein [Gammaproteobacteria bacterium]|nr:radical SAM protein [Gammaproteobacteria bacterium]